MYHDFKLTTEVSVFDCFPNKTSDGYCNLLGLRGKAVGKERKIYHNCMVVAEPVFLDADVVKAGKFCWLQQLTWVNA